MTRRGIFLTLAGIIAGLFGPARSWGWQSPEVALTPGPYKTINSAINIDKLLILAVAKHDWSGLK